MAMKRPASAGVESAKKRVKPVAAALMDCEDYQPGGMLASCLEFSLGVFKECRSDQQNQVVGFVGQALAKMKADLEVEVAEAEKKTTGVHADKEARVKAESAAEAALDGLKSALAAAQGEEAEVSGKAKEADAALKVVEDEQKTGDKEINGVIAKKKKVTAAQADAYVPLKEGQAFAEAAVKKMNKQLAAVGKEFGFDSSLLESAPAALAKKPEDRGDFDKTILGHLDTQFQKCLEDLDSQIAALEPSSKERGAKAEAAKAVAETAAAALQSKKDAVKAAKDSLKAGEKAKKDATASVNNWLPDIKALFDSFEEAQKALKEFEEGPLKVYSDLKEMETPPAPVEEEEEEAAADETAPAEEAAPAEPAAAPAEAAAGGVDVPAA